jgi:hypothetical protein
VPSRATTFIAALLTAAGLTLALPSTADAAGARPRTGQCHQLTYRQAWAQSDTKRAVACSARHDMQTIAVVTSPISLAGLTDEQLSTAERACYPAFLKAVRPLSRYAMTAYDLWTFVPTPAQRSAGARWIRCDVALWRGAGLAPLPRHRLPRSVVPQHLTDSVRACLTQRKLTTTCDQRHVLRAVTAFSMSQAAYPSREQFIAAADRRCPAGWDYATWPGQVSWSYGVHTVTCYDRTRK